MLPVVAAIYLIMSLVTLVAFLWDKRAAAAGRRRTPESWLHMSELLGGWVGALIAMRLFRHKSSKVRYYMVTWAIAALHSAAWIAWFMLA